MSEEDQMAYAQAIVGIRRLLSGDIKNSQVIMEEMMFAFKEWEMKQSRLQSDLKTVVMNIKPEYLEEMKKLIVPEIFERLGL